MDSRTSTPIQTINGTINGPSHTHTPVDRKIECVCTDFGHGGASRLMSTQSVVGTFQVAAALGIDSGGPNDHKTFLWNPLKKESH